MATQTRNPTSDTSFTGTWSGSAGTRYQAVDDHPDSGNPINDGLTHGTTAGEGLMGFSAFSVPAGATSISVQVIYYDFKNAAQACNVRARIRCNDTTGQDAPGGTHNPGNGNGNIALRTDDYGANNPKSGIAWTVDDVNGVGTNALTAFGVVSTDANPTITISSIISRSLSRRRRPATTSPLISRARIPQVTISPHLPKAATPRAITNRPTWPAQEAAHRSATISPPTSEDRMLPAIISRPIYAGLLMQATISPPTCAARRPRRTISRHSCTAATPRAIRSQPISMPKRAPMTTSLLTSTAWQAEAHPPATTSWHSCTASLRLPIRKQPTHAAQTAQQIRNHPIFMAHRRRQMRSRLTLTARTRPAIHNRPIQEARIARRILRLPICKAQAHSPHQASSRPTCRARRSSRPRNVNLSLAQKAGATHWLARLEQIHQPIRHVQ